jgi:hypothetical protein
MVKVAKDVASHAGLLLPDENSSMSGLSPGIEATMMEMVSSTMLKMSRNKYQHLS